MYKLYAIIQLRKNKITSVLEVLYNKNKTRLEPIKLGISLVVFIVLSKASSLSTHQGLLCVITVLHIGLKAARSGGDQMCAAG